MKKTNFILCLLPLLVTALVYNMIPDTIPMHYDSKGNVDRYGGKVEILLISLFLTIVLLVIYYFVIIKKHNQSNNYEFTLFTCLGIAFYIVLFLFENIQVKFISGYMYRNALIILGLFFLSIGVSITKLKRNIWIGLRTSKSLKSDESWEKSQKLARVIFCLLGLIGIVLGLIFNNAQSLNIYVITIIGFSIVLIILSNVLIRNEDE